MATPVFEFQCPTVVTDQRHWRGRYRAIDQGLIRIEVNVGYVSDRSYLRLEVHPVFTMVVDESVGGAPKVPKTERGRVHRCDGYVTPERLMKKLAVPLYPGEDEVIELCASGGLDFVYLQMNADVRGQIRVWFDEMLEKGVMTC